MWVADMNFATCPSVTDALKKRIDHPLFGYFLPDEDYYERIINWHKSSFFADDLQRKYIGTENGVHGFIMSCINVFTKPGDKILLHRPYYVGFMNDIKGTGREGVFSDLILDDSGLYRMDYDDMERKLSENNIRLVIFCSPHNPTGRVWKKAELKRVFGIFKRHDCIVISDEIWADIILRDNSHIPAYTVSPWAKENTLCAYAISKTFNLAGLNAAYHVIYNKNLRKKICSYSDLTMYNSPNVLNVHALKGAYTDTGAEWVRELNEVLYENTQYICDFLNAVGGISAPLPQGTYMIYADMRDYCKNNGRSIEDILHAGWDVGVGWQDGRAFGGEFAIRINVALPLSRIKEACRRLKEYVF